MKTMKLRSHIGSDGILLLQMPAEFKDTSVEVVVVVQTLPSQEIKPS
jgi:predicted Zn-dependent protease with MMP-like domain